MKKTSLIAIGCLILDQVVKWLVIYNMDVNDSIKVIDHFFIITYVTNDRAAWSLFSGNSIILVIMSLIMLSLIYLVFLKDKSLTLFDNISYGFLIGGILGNLADRLAYGYVIDYLAFRFFDYQYPICN